MGVDGIGKSGGIGASRGIEAPPSTEPSPADSFSVEPGAEAGGAVGPDELAQLQRGELTVEQYLDARVQDATRHIVDSLPADHLDFVRKTLRAQLESDPVLTELLRQTIGRRPTE